MKRVEKLAQLCLHPSYKKVARALTEAEFDFCVEFCEENADLEPLQFEDKVNRLFIDDKARPKNSSVICELLLPCATLD